MSERIDINGMVKKVGDEQVFGESFHKKELWLEIDRESKNPQTICVEFTQYNVHKLDSITEGDEVEISINLRGRYHEPSDRVYNSIVGWFIKKISDAAPAQSEPADEALEGDEEYEDSIPF